MTATPSERSKAYRIEAKGDRASADERAWLASYRARKAGPRLSVQTMAPDASGTFVAIEEEPIDPPAPSSSTATTTAPGDALAHPRTCTIKNCYACEARSQAPLYEVCEATGERVWRELDRDAAELVAAGVLIVIGIGIAAVRWYQGKGWAITLPRAAERRMLAKKIAPIIRRHFGWLVGGESYLGLLLPLGAYTTRAWRGADAEDLSALGSGDDDDDDDDDDEENADASD